MSPRMVVEAQLVIYLLDSNGLGTDYEVWLSWSPSAPWTICLEIPTSGAAAVEWTFDRELLWTGLNRPAGRGDVRIAPVTDPDSVYFGDVAVYLRGAGRGWTQLYFDRGELWEFLQETKPHFPAARDAARAGLDTEIADLLDQCGGAR